MAAGALSGAIKVSRAVARIASLPPSAVFPRDEVAGAVASAALGSAPDEPPLPGSPFVAGFASGPDVPVATFSGAAEVALGSGSSGSSATVSGGLSAGSAAGALPADLCPLCPAHHQDRVGRQATVLRTRTGEASGSMT